MGPVDAVLVLSFGGPEGPDEVLPFLKNVTRGRGIPDERLRVVGEHYYHFDGISPINALNRSIVARLKDEFATRHIELPVYWGNRNWHPMLEDTVQTMAQEGIKNALVLSTSAYGGYSACRQYHEDIARARAEVPAAPRMEKLPHTYLNELFLDGNRTAVAAALADDQLAQVKRTRLVFTAHSVPTRANDEAGVEGQLYSAQLSWVASQIAADLEIAEWDLVWQSRSGPPQVPWLEPDICDHLEALAEAGYDGVVIAPIGFISDHMEVIWDLDTEALAKTQELGLTMVRASTISEDPLYIKMVADLIERRLGIGDHVAERIAPMQGSSGIGVNGEPCQVGCCGAPRE